MIQPWVSEGHAHTFHIETGQSAQSGASTFVGICGATGDIYRVRILGEFPRCRECQELKLASVPGGDKTSQPRSENSKEGMPMLAGRERLLSESGLTIHTDNKPNFYKNLATSSDGGSRPMGSFHANGAAPDSDPLQELLLYSDFMRAGIFNPHTPEKCDCGELVVRHCRCGKGVCQRHGYQLEQGEPGTPILCGECKAEADCEVWGELSYGRAI